MFSPATAPERHLPLLCLSQWDFLTISHHSSPFFSLFWLSRGWEGDEEGAEPAQVHKRCPGFWSTKWHRKQSHGSLWLPGCRTGAEGCIPSWNKSAASWMSGNSALERQKKHFSLPFSHFSLLTHPSLPASFSQPPPALQHPLVLPACPLTVPCSRGSLGSLCIPAGGSKHAGPASRPSWVCSVWGRVNI